jgi:hypothetical protein
MSRKMIIQSKLLYCPDCRRKTPTRRYVWSLKSEDDPKGVKVLLATYVMVCQICGGNKMQTVKQGEEGETL